MLRLHPTGATISGRLTVLSWRIPRPLACRPASCLTWLPTMLPDKAPQRAPAPGLILGPRPSQGKRGEPVATLTFRKRRVGA